MAAKCFCRAKTRSARRTSSKLQSTARRVIGSREIRDHIHVKMQDKLEPPPWIRFDGRFCRSCWPHSPHISRSISAQRRLAQQSLLRPGPAGPLRKAPSPVRAPAAARPRIAPIRPRRAQSSAKPPFRQRSRTSSSLAYADQRRGPCRSCRRCESSGARPRSWQERSSNRRPGSAAARRISLPVRREASALRMTQLHAGKISCAGTFFVGLVNLEGSSPRSATS